MKAYNTTTHENVEITVTDLFTGYDWASDATGETDDFSFNEESERFEADNDTIAWWVEYERECVAANTLWDNVPDGKREDVIELYNKTYQEFNDAPCILTNAISNICK